MQITNTYWEERNTGLKSCEVVFEKGDKFQDYLKSDIEIKYEFSVVKIPSGNLEIVHQLEGIGYRYLENQMKLSFEVEQVSNIDLKWKKLLNGFTCKTISTEEEMDSILNEISNNMFEADRFTLDPLWSKGISSKRYMNWTRDLFQTPSVKFYTIEKEGKEIGFFADKKESESVNSCPIAGIYNNYKSAGYIFVLTWFWLLKSKEMGYKKVTTSVSSNNRAILSSLSRVFSFSIRETHIVLRKVINN